MYYVVAQSLSLEDGDVDASQAVELGPDENTVGVRIHLLNSAGTFPSPLTVTVQGSNDLDAWDDLNLNYQASIWGPSPLDRFIPSGSSSQSPIPFRYVRLKYENESGAEVIVDASLNTAQLG